MIRRTRPEPPASACPQARVLSLAGVIAATAVLTGVPLHVGPTQARGEADATFGHGFRHDPMAWAADNESLNGAVVRKLVFDRATEADEALIRGEIGQILAQRRDDGALADGPGEAARRLLRLFDLGLPVDAPETGRAADALLGQLRATDVEPIRLLDAARTLCLTGHGDAPETQSILAWWALADPMEGIASPWTLSSRLEALWDCRGTVDLAKPLDAYFEFFGEQLTEAGTICFTDTWTLLRACAERDDAFARDIVARMVPAILRSQAPDGGWEGHTYWGQGGHTLTVLRALTHHGLLEQLRALQPLPPDWEIPRSIPLPEGDVYGLTWGDGKLWTCERQTNDALALSPEDGEVLDRLRLPDGYGCEIGWWDDCLALTHGTPGPGPREPETHRLLKIDPATGDVVQEVSLDFLPRVGSVAQVNAERFGDRLWLSDRGEGILYFLDPMTLEHNYGPDVAGANVRRLCPADQGVWHDDGFLPLLIKSDRNGWRLLDWGERPFEGRCDGLAWDGENLWALDVKGGRICIIEKADAK